jgi:hypothetical protein
MNNQVNTIQLDYPEFYKISRKLHAYDKQVSDLFIKNYGQNTFDNLMVTNEYNAELENVSLGILKNTDLSKLAQKRKTIFEEYSNITYEISQKIGYSKMLEYMNILDRYFKTIYDFI